MENPDVELALERDGEGNVIHMSYKVHNREDESRSALELGEIASVMLEAEGHEFISVYVDTAVMEDSPNGDSKV